MVATFSPTIDFIIYYTSFYLNNSFQKKKKKIHIDGLIPYPEKPNILAIHNLHSLTRFPFLDT